MTSPPGAASFAVLAADLQSQVDEVDTARRVVSRLLDLVADADAVSLTVTGVDGHRTLAAAGDLATRADALQYALDEGPCVDVVDAVPWIRSAAVVDDARWPHWGPAAGALGVGALLSVQVPGRDGPGGALNVYSTHVDRFVDDDVLDLTAVYAVHAGNALLAAGLAGRLRTAIGSRHTIGMAQGIVMERFGLDRQQSFELLRRLSASRGVGLRDLAAQVVATRSMPDAAALAALTTPVD